MNVYDVWLSNIEIGNKLKLDLLEKFQNSENIWNLDVEEYLKYDINGKYKDIFFDKNFRNNAIKYLDYIIKNDILLINFFDELYPNNLKYIKNPPPFLYVRGNIKNLYDDNVAIVGSRMASDYGKKIARKFAKELADKNINVVSGLANGIDKYAHLGALDSEIGKTIAVLATGVSDMEVYPLENKKIFERIIFSGGTIISEFKINSKPEKYHFPIRNRIISGLSKKVIVVEAKEKSGSLITANYALEQGKDVYAVPGNITSQNSIGTNQLIFDGAYILKNIEDLFIV